jgi:hypothetical protein
MHWKTPAFFYGDVYILLHLMEPGPHHALCSICWCKHEHSHVPSFPKNCMVSYRKVHPRSILCMVRGTMSPSLFYSSHGAWNTESILVYCVWNSYPTPVPSCARCVEDGTTTLLCSVLLVYCSREQSASWEESNHCVKLNISNGWELCQILPPGGLTPPPCTPSSVHPTPFTPPHPRKIQYRNKIYFLKPAF